MIIKVSARGFFFLLLHYSNYINYSGKKTKQKIGSNLFELIKFHAKGRKKNKCLILL